MDIDIDVVATFSQLCVLRGKLKAQEESLPPALQGLMLGLQGILAELVDNAEEDAE